MWWIVHVIAEIISCIFIIFKNLPDKSVEHNRKYLTFWTVFCMLLCKYGIFQMQNLRWYTGCYSSLWTCKCTSVVMHHNTKATLLVPLSCHITFQLWGTILNFFGVKNVVKKFINGQNDYLCSLSVAFFRVGQRAAI